MRLAFYQMGAFVICVDSDTVWKGFEQGARSFRVEASAPDVQYTFRTVDPTSLTLPPLSRSEILRLSGLLFCRNQEWRSPLFRSPLVRERMEARLTEQRGISLDPADSTLTIYDFVRAECESFHLPQWTATLTDWIPAATLLAPFLPALGALILHSSGIVRGGRTAMFLAPNGGGKSTVARRTPEGLVLGDDQVILRRAGETLLAYGSPWGMIAASTGKAPAGAFFFLEQADEFRLTRLRPREALEYLWVEHAHNFRFLPMAHRLHAFDLALSVCKDVPAYQMRFAKDFIDWAAIDAAMAAR